MFLKSFSGLLVTVATAGFVLAACGSDTPDTAESDNSQVNQSVTPISQTPMPPTPTPEAPAETTPARTATAEPSEEFAALPAPYKDADYRRGRRVFNSCGSCHLVEEGAGNRVGPNLSGLFGRQVGAVEDFNYSNAVQEADFIWTPELLDDWLTNPRSFLPGNRMNFAGVRRPEDRTALIAYLMVETGWAPE